MTVGDCLNFVDDCKPNAFPPFAKLKWLSEIEGRIASEIFLMAPAEIRQFDYTPEMQNYKLLLDPPWDDIYIAYLIAKTDSKNGEFNRLSTAAQAFNRKWNELSAYVANLYTPGNGYYFRELERGAPVQQLLDEGGMNTYGDV